MTRGSIRRSPALTAATLGIAALATLAPAMAAGADPAIGDFRLLGVSLRPERYLGRPALHLEMPRAAWQDATRDWLSDRDFKAWLPVDFSDGTIEVDVASDLALGAPAVACGFVGLAFRIDAAAASRRSTCARPMRWRTIRCAATAAFSTPPISITVSIRSATRRRASGSGSGQGQLNGRFWLMV